MQINISMSAHKWVIQPQGPWLCMGDFNTVLSAGDRENGRPVTPAEYQDFNAWINDMELTVMRSRGSYFSWTNKSHGLDRVSSRIDWALINEDLINAHPRVEAIYVNPSLSDHWAICVDCGGSVSKKGKPFRFLNALADHKDFDKIVHQQWQANTPGCKMKQVWHKLKQVKLGLKELNSKEFANIENKIQQAQDDLDDIQTQLSTNFGDEDLHIRETEAVKRVKHWMNVHESILKQKARISWIKLGDSNTRYFFSAMKQRQHQNRIDSLMTDLGILLQTPEAIRD